MVPNGAVTSAVLVHLRVEPAHFDWRWRERPVLALLAWEALARDPLARLRRIQVESIWNDINFRPAAISNRTFTKGAVTSALCQQHTLRARSECETGAPFGLTRH